MAGRLLSGPDDPLSNRAGKQAVSPGAFPLAALGASG
jgi:hypothetical protein